MSAIPNPFLEPPEDATREDPAERQSWANEVNVGLQQRRTGAESVLQTIREVRVLQRAVEVIGDEPAAMRWLGTPVRLLDYTTPVSLLHSADGCEAVLSVLGQLEHGVL